MQATHSNGVGEFWLGTQLDFPPSCHPRAPCPRFVTLPALLGCFVRSAVAWAAPEQRCGAIEKIIGFSLKQFYADAIEPARSVKVRPILGPIQMRTGQYTLRQMSKPISSFSLTGGSVCRVHRGLWTLLRESDLLPGTKGKFSGPLSIGCLQTFRKLQCRLMSEMDEELPNFLCSR